MKQNYLKKRLLVAFVLTLSMFGFVAKAQLVLPKNIVQHWQGGSGLVVNLAGSILILDSL